MLVGVAVLWLILPDSVRAQSTQGPVAAYGFNEGAGSVVGDVSGFGNTGNVNGAFWTSLGRYGNALEFDGKSAPVEVPASPSLDFTEQVTLEAWVYPAATPTRWQDVIYRWDDAYYLDATSQNGGLPGTGIGPSSPLYGSDVLPVTTWSHLAATYDGTTQRLYVNGALVSSQPHSGPIPVTTGPLSIGGDKLYGQQFTGRIDEVRIYDRALSAGEIQTDMDTPVTAVADTTSPTVSIVAPNAGTVGGTTQIQVLATDNVGVGQVELFVDGTSVGVDPTSPYLIGWNTTTLGNGPHTLTAAARDLAGNEAISAPVNVSTLNPVFVNEVVVPDITSAVTLCFLPDGRMLVGELIERVRVVQPGASVPDPTPFLQLDASNLFGEQGLFDVILDPDFETNGYYYVFYTQSGSSSNHDTVSRFTASGNTTVPGSEVVLWQDPVAANAEHHGGTILFGPDGDLYIATGEHFNAPDAQRLDSYRGKILRIRPDGTIPPDNPFADGPGGNLDEIWAYGLRNPFRASFDLATGRLFIGDVGGNDASIAKEEVNIGAPGANFGWPLCEGPCAVPGTTDPVYWYPHNGRDASVTGGIVYRGSQFPSEYVGSYFVADYVQNWIKRLTFDAAGNLTGVVDFEPPDGSSDGPYGDPVKLIEGPDGSLYYIDIGFNDQHVPNEAAIRRIRYAVDDQPPVAVASADPVEGEPPLLVAFSSAGSLDPEGEALTYRWDFGDGAASNEENPSYTYTAKGLYVARLTVSDGINTALSSDLTIAVGTPPTATILAPADGSSFHAGDVISFSGSATDSAGNPLPASAYTWTILFHHDTHIHPGAGPLTGIVSDTFAIPTTGHDFAGSTYYEFILSVEDADGLRSAATVTIFPEKVALPFQTSPPGLSLEVDGVRKLTPFVQDTVEGFRHTINAPEQSSGDSIYEFASWSDGGAQSHEIVVPSTPTTWQADFAPAIGSTGLVASWSFDEGSGTTAGDASGFGNTATLDGATWSPAGRYGGALSFDGLDDLLSVAASASLDLTTGMTLEAWLLPASSGSWRDVIYKTGDRYYLEASSPSGSPAVGAVGLTPEVFAPTALPLDTWSHLAATYDGTRLRVYVNGVDVAAGLRSGQLSTSTEPLYIGGNPAFGQHFDGLIDEVRIYNRALTLGEIETDMATPISSLTPVPLGGRGLRPVLALALILLGSSALLWQNRRLHVPGATR